MPTEIIYPKSKLMIYIIFGVYTSPFFSSTFTKIIWILEKVKKKNIKLPLNLKNGLIAHLMLKQQFWQKKKKILSKFPLVWYQSWFFQTPSGFSGTIWWLNPNPTPLTSVPLLESFVVDLNPQQSSGRRSTTKPLECYVIGGTRLIQVVGRWGGEIWKLHKTRFPWWFWTKSYFFNC